MNQPSLFTQIIRGDIPCHKIYEDDRTFAFLDIHPHTPGHVLVIPKTEVEFVWDMSDEDYQAVMTTCRKIALRQREILEVSYVGEKIIGTDVPHAHVHLIPFNSADEYAAFADLNEEPDHESLAAMAKKLAF